MRTLGLQAAAGADSRHIADASVAVWAAIDTALSPVIGHRGCAALYRRSLHLVRADHAWMTGAYEGATTPGDFESLHGALAQQGSVEGATAHDALVQTFQDLLAELIGRSLTERLLQAAWDSHSGRNTDRDNSP